MAVGVALKRSYRSGSSGWGSPKYGNSTDLCCWYLRKDLCSAYDGHLRVVHRNKKEEKREEEQFAVWPDVNGELFLDVANVINFFMFESCVIELCFHVVYKNILLYIFFSIVLTKEWDHQFISQSHTFAGENARDPLVACDWG